MQTHPFQPLLGPTISLPGRPSLPIHKYLTPPSWREEISKILNLSMIRLTYLHCNPFIHFPSSHTNTPILVRLTYYPTQSLAMDIELGQNFWGSNMDQDVRPNPPPAQPPFPGFGSTRRPWVMVSFFLNVSIGCMLISMLNQDKTVESGWLSEKIALA